MFILIQLSEMHWARKVNIKGEGCLNISLAKSSCLKSTADKCKELDEAWKSLYLPCNTLQIPYNALLSLDAGFAKV